MPKRLLAVVVLTVFAATGCEDPGAVPRTTRTSPSGAPVTRATARASTPPPKPAATRKPAPKSLPPKPTVKPPAKPKPVVASTCGAPANPWGYNFCGRGGLIASPPVTFCAYFLCIDSFWENTAGHVMRCDDGRYSHSGGRRGSCSHHGGNDRPLYG